MARVTGSPARPVTTEVPRVGTLRRVIPAFGDVLSYDQAMDVVANTLRWGGLAFGPSDPGYTVWALPNHPKAIQALDVVLDHAEVAIPLTVASLDRALDLVDFTLVQRRLAGAAWPGGLTIVGRPANHQARKFSRTLHAPGTLGVRVSRSHIERQLTTEAGIALTSAAVRYPDGGVVTDYDDVEAIVLDRVSLGGLTGVPLVGIPYVEKFPLKIHSTVVGLCDDDSISILRPGMYEKRELVAMASRIAVHEYADAT